MGGLLCLTGCPYLWGPPAYVDPSGKPAEPEDSEPEVLSDTSEEETEDTGEEPTVTDTAPPEVPLDGTFEGNVSIECVADTVSDTCTGGLTVQLEETAAPQLDGIGICGFAGELEVAGYQSIALSGGLLVQEVSGEVSLPLFDTAWSGVVGELQLSGSFVGQTRISVPGHGNTDFVCTGTFELARYGSSGSPTSP
jgi:hypothetical protein